MSMIAVISDVHGNFPALRAVMMEIEMSGCQRIISLGDVDGYYCNINECLENEPEGDTRSHYQSHPVRRISRNSDSAIRQQNK